MKTSVPTKKGTKDLQEKDLKSLESSGGKTEAFVKGGIAGSRPSIKKSTLNRLAPKKNHLGHSKRNPGIPGSGGGEN